MPRRVLVLPASLVIALLVIAGCQGRQRPVVVPREPVAVKAADAPVEKPPLEITPGSSTITADDVGLQLLAARKDAGSPRDLTGDVQWTIEPAGLAEIEKGGYLRPRAAGEATVKASFEGQTATSRITVEARSDRSWDFGHDIVPIFTRLGCNTGGCHGRAAGQNGFHLSLYGYDSAGDFLALARDAGQRRLSKLSPKQSLFLDKATGRVAHGGGPRLKVGSPEYETLLAWVQDGAPETRARDTGRSSR